MRKLSFFSLDDEQIKECDEAGLCCPDDLIDDVFMASLPLLDDALLDVLGVDCSPPPPPLMNVDAAALSSMSWPFERWDVPTKPRRQPAAARKRPWSHPSLSFGVPAGPAAPDGRGVGAVNAGEFGNDTKPGKFCYGGNLSRLGHGGNAGEFGNDTKSSKFSYGSGGVGGGKLSRLDHVAGELGGGRKRPAGRQRDRPEGQRCGHCHTTETPQWRNGPDGPSTLCNACGIRFRMGSNKLVPEYRPSTSPFFRSGEHSNRHSKVQKLREKKVKALKLDGDRQTPPPM